MKRFTLLFVCTLMLTSSGCCLFGRTWSGQQCGYGPGYPQTYGGYGGGQMAPGGCPTGACGQYPGAYVGGAPTAAVPYGYPQSALLDPLPVY